MALRGSLKGVQYRSDHLGSLKQPLLRNPVLQGQRTATPSKGAAAEWEAAGLQLHRVRLLLRTAQAEGLTPRKGAEGSLTCCTPGKGGKVGGSPEPRLAAGGEEWDSPSSPGAARYPSAGQTGIPKWHQNTYTYTHTIALSATSNALLGMERSDYKLE